MSEPDCPKALKQIRRVVTAVGGSGRALLDFSTRPLSDGEGILINELLRRYNLHDELVEALKGEERMPSPEVVALIKKASPQ